MLKPTLGQSLERRRSSERPLSSSPCPPLGLAPTKAVMSSNGHASPSAPVKKVSLSFKNNELGGGARRSFSREGSFLGNSNPTSAVESSPPSPFSKQAEFIRGGRKSPEPFSYPETKPIYPETKPIYPEPKPPAPAEDEPLEVHAEERKRQHMLAQEHLKAEPVEASVLRHVQYTLARRHQPLTAPDLYLATALSVRERLIERWTDTQSYYTAKDPKRVCYLSLEYLVGRCLQNTIHNLGVENEYTRGIAALGYELEDLAAEEHDPALGNGGLGRLASCFLDSMATLNYPAWGYGIRYRYGMFEQRIEGGQQREVPDYWLQGHTNPWEVQRLDISYPVRFYGHVQAVRQGRNLRYQWEGGEVVKAEAFDSPIPGYGTCNTNTMRLWSSCAWDEFDLGAFNAGQLAAASEARVRAESISAVLYPNDHTDAGKELRLKQQFFFVSATLQDVVQQLKRGRRPLAELPDKVAIQLNDTHPTIAIPELMRIILDEEGLEWAEAWSISTRTFAYTNHTILPEALERWPVPLLERLLPRHMQIIYEINHRHLQEVEARWPHDTERLSALSIIEESFPKMVRMAVLAIVGSHSVNGVAEIHTGLVRTRLFPQLADMWPERFNNKTNGVTPRRWLLLANPSLAALLTKWLGGQAWVTDVERLRILRAHASNADLQQEWAASKRVNKLRLAEYIEHHCGVQVSADALFDVHVKRIHEYKRQLLNILSIVHRYNAIKAASPEERARMVPHVKVFAGKAAAGYYLAKRVIHLINSVAAVVNGDPDVGPLLKVVFLANYNVSLAEVIIPASDISQHVSTAGMEASGTSNMKFALNGGLILGTMDGANIEIADAIGRHNMFVFGAAAEDTDGLRREMAYQPPPTDERLQQVYSCIEAGVFGPASEFRAILDSLQHGNDYYLLAHDFPSYLEAQADVDRVFTNKADWIQRSIVSASCMGRFSSDRTISEYARNIWHLEAVPCPE